MEKMLLKSTTRHVRIFTAEVVDDELKFHPKKLTLDLDPDNEFIWNENSLNKINEKFNELINNNGYRSKVDIRNEKIGYKIREATLGRIPLIAVIGDKEEETDSVALRALDGRNLGIFNLPNLYKLMDGLIEKRGRTE